MAEGPLGKSSVGISQCEPQTIWVTQLRFNELASALWGDAEGYTCSFCYLIQPLFLDRKIVSKAFVMDFVTTEDFNIWRVKL